MQKVRIERNREKLEKYTSTTPWNQRGQALGEHGRKRLYRMQTDSSKCQGTGV